MNEAIKGLRIGGVQLENNVAMAPLAGVTTAPFRALCHRYGAGLTVTELVSARGLVYDRELVRNARYLALDEEDRPVALQLFGHVADDFSRAIRRLLSDPCYGRFDLIDINMGCPVPKVMKTGAGAALMGAPDRARAIVEAAVEAADGLPVTVKMRSGLDATSINAPAFARLLERAGAAAVTVHARTAAARYGGQADWSVIRAVREELTLPLFGNGDLETGDDLRRMQALTQVDGFMIGRAALGKPWLFARLLGRPQPDRAAVLQELLERLVLLLGEAIAVREMRTLFAAAVKGEHQAALWRQRFFQARTAAEQQELIALCFGERPPLLERQTEKVEK